MGSPQRLPPQHRKSDGAQEQAFIHKRSPFPFCGVTMLWPRGAELLVRTAR
jgi:hypothetical protein